jgi:hypothetical protein
MNQISAAENLVIDMEADRWRLLANGDYDTRVLMDAAPGQPLRYLPGFGSTRRLPSSGQLSLEDVQRVVLGWSNKDEAWHLGLILEQDLAAARGSRWCEIAHWPDPDTNVFFDLASQAGKTLATTIARPFNLIPPRVEQSAPPPPPVILPPLPLKMGLWTLDWADTSKRRRGNDLIGETTYATPAERAFQFARTSSWTVSKVLRIGWYSLWVTVYLILSIATLTRTLALPNSGTMLPTPEVLPILGLVSAVVLAGMIFYNLYELFYKPDRVVVDPQTRTVTAFRGGSQLWQTFGDGALAVYVTQVVAKKSKKPVVHHGEINLHLGGEEFFRILDQGEGEESNRPWKANLPLDQEVVVPIDGDLVNTDLQAAALYVARALGNLPCRYDQRVK